MKCFAHDVQRGMKVQQSGWWMMTRCHIRRHPVFILGMAVACDRRVNGEDFRDQRWALDENGVRTRCDNTLVCFRCCHLLMWERPPELAIVRVVWQLWQGGRSRAWSMLEAMMNDLGPRTQETACHAVPIVPT